MSAESGSPAEWSSWIAAILGLWVLVSPFVLGEPASGTTAYWSDIVVGIVIAILAAYTAYVIRGG